LFCIFEFPRHLFRIFDFPYDVGARRSEFCSRLAVLAAIQRASSLVMWDAFTLRRNLRIRGSKFFAGVGHQIIAAFLAPMG
jgi:hypothetical protein